jgi:hypothetical protein
MVLVSHHIVKGKSINHNVIAGGPGIMWSYTFLESATIDAPYRIFPQ